MRETPYVQAYLHTDEQVEAAEDALMAALHTTDREIRIVHGLGPLAHMPRDPAIHGRVLMVYTRPWLADLLWRLEHGATEHVADALLIAQALRRQVGPIEARPSVLATPRRPS